jgi:hypothetical protein
MILASTSVAAAIPFTPSWLTDEPDPPVYRLRAGSVIERELMEAELAGEFSAGTVYQWELHAAILAGFEHLGGDDAEGLVELANMELAGAEMDDAQRATLADAKRVLQQHWPEYRALTAQMERRNTLLPVVAFRRFCVGWENVVQRADGGVSFARGPDGCVAEVALKRVDPLHLRAAGIRAYSIQYGAGMEKNSDAPSRSGDGPGTSHSGAITETAGSSPETDTTKTPA